MALKLSGYTRVERGFDALRLSADYIAVTEELERAMDFGVVLPSRGNATVGVVDRVAPMVEEMFGVAEGDRVLFSEWQGGRWAFLDPSRSDGEKRCLIMSSEYILAKLE